jgi:dihydropyrimidinase
MVDLIIENGLVITETGGIKANIAVKDQIIVAIYSGDIGLNSETRVDATGCIVTPGGIDPHVHIPEELGSKRGDFFSEGIAALFGGTTTVIEFLKSGEKNLQECFDFKKDITASISPLDFSFHALIYHQVDIDYIEPLYEKGISTFKHIMADCNGMTGLQTGFQYRSFQKIHEVGGLAIVHAENDEIQSYIKKEMIAKGLKHPKDHANSRTVISEVEAISRSILLAQETDIPLHVFHVSSRRGAETILEAKKKGLPVTGETCPHYLLFTRQNLPEYGPFLQINPALKELEDREKLWEYINDGTLKMVTSDHYAPLKSEKEPGWENCWTIEGGVPGIETRVPLLIGEGVSNNKITWDKLVSLTSTEPAKLFRLYPKKGVIRVGSDADIVIWENKPPVSLRLDHLHQTADWTPYEGKNIHEGPKAVFLRGEKVVEGRKFLGQRGLGEFLSRG